MENAIWGIEELKVRVDTLIVVSNQRLLAVIPRTMHVLEAFRFGNEILFNAIKGIAETITNPGLINLDFADIRTVMSEKGAAVMGMGIAGDENRAEEAATKAISSPLLDDLTIKGARGLLINVSGGDDFSLFEVNTAATLIYNATESKPVTISGVTIDQSLTGKIKVTVIATGLKDKAVSLPSDNIPDLGAFTTKHEKSELETPTFRRLERTKEIRKTEIDENNLEIPTFLRKQID